MNTKKILKDLQNRPCGQWVDAKTKKLVKHLFKDSLNPGTCPEEYKLIELALKEARYSALGDLLKAVEKGKIGEIDYYWNGKKVIRDNILFKRGDLVNFFRREYYGAPKKEVKK